jgi:hypothetical protein
MQNSKVQAELPVVMTPFKGQRLVELHEDPDTPTKIAEALIKQTDEEQTECWLNSGSPPQQSKGFQRPSLQKVSSQLAGKQVRDVHLCFDSQVSYAHMGCRCAKLL